MAYEKEYTFDLKLWATVRVKAESEAAARAAINAEIDCIDIAMQIDAENGAVIRFSEACVEGEADLIEIDDEAV